MHTHHSHSGDYVSHATDTLEGITQKAIDMGFETFCMTEHMPRLESKFLYPEELEQNFQVETLKFKFEQFYQHAKKLQKEKIENGCKTHFLVGLEVEGINDAHIDYTTKLLNKFEFDMIVGSVHYVKEIPIDFDRKSWELARDACGGDIRSLFKEYFELQYKVLTKLKPIVVGHFDLIRLFCKEDDFDDTTGFHMKDIILSRDWPEVWKLIIRNLEFVKSYGGIIEFNSAAIRKGWETPYPKLDISQAVVDHCDGRFCLSDDSHSVAQVGLNYHKVLEYIKVLKLQKIYYLDLDVESMRPVVKEKLVDQVASCGFWKQYK